MIQFNNKSSNLIYWKVEKSYKEKGCPIYNKLYDKRYEKPVFEYKDYPYDESKYILKDHIVFNIPLKNMNYKLWINLDKDIEFNLPSQYKDYISSLYLLSFNNQQK